MAAISSPTIARSELHQLASDLVPVLKERAKKAEELRQMPPETIRDLRDSGLLHIATPPMFGGSEHDIDVMFDIAMELGRGCGSTAWNYAVWSIHNWMVGHWPEQGQQEYFAEGPAVLSGSAFAPMGKLEPVPGGYTLTGRWDFSSGCDGGTWEMLTATSPDGLLMALVPAGDYEILDTWFVSGLKGTGSKDVVVNGAFVPEHRVTPFASMGVGSKAYELHGRPSYRLPALSFLPASLASAVIGAARGAVEEFTNRFAGKTGPGRTGESVALQLRLAEASAEVDAAMVVLKNRVAITIEAANQGAMLDALQQAAYRRDMGYAAKLCVQAVNRLFDASGGHALYDSNPMQRFQRDVHAAAHHIALTWDGIAESYGRAAFGLPPLDMRR